MSTPAKQGQLYDVVEAEIIGDGLHLQVIADDDPIEFPSECGACPA